MDKEFSLSHEEFDQIRKLVYEHSGISLCDSKRDMIYSRLSKRLRKLGLKSFRDYCAILDLSDSDELGNFINSVTTNLTSFFREGHHFDYLRDTLLPFLLEQRRHERRIRIWSAGCSTGEEPYSIAMSLYDAVPEGWQVKILATDLDTNVLAQAREGVYAEERVRALPESVLKHCFVRGTGAAAGKVRVKQHLRDMIMFKQLNLMGAWPLKPDVDVIFCRNVVIYFDKQTQAKLFDRYADILASHGHLFVGHSETLYKVSERFSLLGNTVYRKIG